MSTEIRVPTLGESVTEATIGRWFKSVGDSVAADEPRTQIGLPEVLLGILPGFGGSTRLPRLIGMSGALDLILTGRSLDARRAEKAGLVARAVPAAWLLDHAQRRLDELQQRPAGKRRDRWTIARFRRAGQRKAGAAFRDGASACRRALGQGIAPVRA